MTETETETVAVTRTDTRLESKADTRADTRIEAEINSLQERMGYHFRDESLLRLALTHPSVFAQTNAPKPLNPPDNQRLEFLGDAVVQLCVSEALYLRHPEMREGDMTKTRITFVRKESLGEAARVLNLGEYMVMGTAERDHGLSARVSVLCDAFEAVTAAVYLDGGFDVARAFVSRSLNDYSENPLTSTLNWKSRLQELMQSAGERTPKYTLVSVVGPPHAPWFTVDVRSQSGQKLGKGSGHSRKTAEQQAAYEASLLFLEARSGSDSERESSSVSVTKNRLVGVAEGDSV
ncbi:ribonuclease 3 [Clostridia bacterium]|nr:ribonuclease 3 [Clostridia bacterium]